MLLTPTVTKSIMNQFFRRDRPQYSKDYTRNKKILLPALHFIRGTEASAPSIKFVVFWFTVAASRRSPGT